MIANMLEWCLEHLNYWTITLLMTIWQYKTKFKSNRIQHNRIKKNTNRSKITRNIT